MSAPIHEFARFTGDTNEFGPSQHNRQDDFQANGQSELHSLSSNLFYVSPTGGKGFPIHQYSDVNDKYNVKYSLDETESHKNFEAKVAGTQKD